MRAPSALAVIALSSGPTLVSCTVAYPLEGYVPREEIDAGDAGADSTRDAGDDGIDAGDAPDATPLDCSAGKHLFCATFDGVPEARSEWKGFFSTGGGSFSLDSSTFTSPTSSFLGRLPTSTAIEVAATVYQDLPAPSPEALFRVELDLRLDAVTYPTVVLLVLVKRGPGGKGVGLAVGPSGLQLQINGSGVGPVTAPVIAGTWHHVRIDGVFATTTTGSVSLYIDDMGKPALTRTAIQTATTTTTDTTLSLGLYSGPGSSSFVARYDDVAFDYP